MSTQDDDFDELLAGEPDERGGSGSPLKAVPGLARLAAGAWLRTAQWSVETGVRSSARLLRAAASGESAAELLHEVREGARSQARTLLGVTDLEERVRGVSDWVTPAGVAHAREERAARHPSRAPAPDPSELRLASLRDRGSALLVASADVLHEDHTHPAYERILDELVPDEARILRLMALEGPQAAIDVRTARPLNVGSELIAPGITMIGARAGVRYVERVPVYLNNLFRLGLLWFSREPVKELHKYQVLEAQPEALEAAKTAGRVAKVVRRSIALTPFGEDFCATCLPVASPIEPVALLQRGEGDGADRPGADVDATARNGSTGNGGGGSGAGRTRR
ncbi:Abi-alpha family protein [Paraconexibacter algicola]|uniref:DUF4393 domain-containing protein n=1 Tax=Paraconexibacter algicola TaxID=2133960 RepID=A0A2T4UDR8_9ACTN|nr:Abi-alpha family protein [Paraconexibacter algicola]PTL55643.1 hypothetical protein C7Y72_18590 [Paraconexibacter algicola]